MFLNRERAVCVAASRTGDSGIVAAGFFGLGFQFRTPGRYWDRKMEIDSWGETTDNRLVIGEIKWTRKRCRKKTYEELIVKLRSLHQHQGTVLLLVSKSGFVKALHDVNDARLVLLDLRDWGL